jgi:hypothetical protein
MSLHRARAAGVGEPQEAPRPWAVSEFERFLASFRFDRSQPWYDHVHDCPTPSHNDLFGGTYRVPDHRPEVDTQFHGQLVAALRDGGVYGLSENRTHFSALYFDLDIGGERAPIELPVLRSLVVLIQDVVTRMAGASATPDHQSLWNAAASAIVATAPPTPDGEFAYPDSPDRGPEKTWKTGAHIIFPDIALDRASMVRVATAAKEYVERTLGPRPPPCNSWSDVFDVGVYRAGLRMILVDKAGPCPSCNGVPTEKCSEATRKRCQTMRCKKGRVPQSRPYRPVAYIRGTDRSDDVALLRHMRANPVIALKRTTIRRPRLHSALPAPPIFDDEAYFLAATAAVANPSAVSSQKAQIGSLLGEAPLRPGMRVLILSSDPRIKVLERLVREYDRRFAALHVRNACTNQTGSTYTIQVGGQGQRACLNCLGGGQHSRSVVHFIADVEHGICQRCSSRSDKTLRSSGKPCRDFAGPWRRITDPAVSEALFGNVKISKSVPLVVENGQVWLPASMILDEEEAEPSQQRPRTRIVKRTEQPVEPTAMLDPDCSPQLPAVERHQAFIHGASVALPLRSTGPADAFGPSLTLPSRTGADARQLLPSSWVVPAKPRKRTASNELLVATEAPSKQRYRTGNTIGAGAALGSGASS